MLAELIPVKWRYRIYRTMSFAALLAGAHGVITDSQASLWVAFIGSLMGTGTAALTRKPTDGET